MKSWSLYQTKRSHAKNKIHISKSNTKKNFNASTIKPFSWVIFQIDSSTPTVINSGLFDASMS